MTEYESKLGLARRVARQRRELTEIYEELSGLDAGKARKQITSVLAKLLPYTGVAAQEE